MMVDHLRLYLGKHFLEKFTVANVSLIEGCARIDVVTKAAGEVVQDGHRVSQPDVRVRNVRSDEACSSGYQNSHFDRQSFLVSTRLLPATPSRRSKPRCEDRVRGSNDRCRTCPFRCAAGKSCSAVPSPAST